MTSPRTNQKSVHKLSTYPTTPSLILILKILSLKAFGALCLLSTSCLDWLPCACDKRGRVFLQHNLVSVDWLYCAWVLNSVQSLSRVRLFATPWTVARQVSLSITNSQSPPKPTSIESVMPSNHLILCRPLLLHLPSFPASGSFQMSQLFA